MSSLILSVEFILGCFLILSSLGVVLSKKPVYSSLWFLVTLILLAALYLQLSAEFIAVMQVLVYAGAILVIFMFVIVLFQDAHQQLADFKPKSSSLLLYSAGILFLIAFAILVYLLSSKNYLPSQIGQGYGTAEGLGKALYIDFFFPFEAVIFLFLIAVVGALYIGRKGA